MLNRTAGSAVTGIEHVKHGSADPAIFQGYQLKLFLKRANFPADGFEVGFSHIYLILAKLCAAEFRPIVGLHSYPSLT